MTKNGKVLVVDDEPNAIKVLSAILRDAGYDVIESLNAEAAIATIRSEEVDAVITDLKMPVTDGFQLFEHITEHRPLLPVMFLTAYGTVDSAVQAMTHGAFYYFLKPPDYTKLKSILAMAIDQYARKRDLENNKMRLLSDAIPCRIIGSTPSMMAITKTIETVRDSESSVLIHGETGTGKEIIARSLHYGSNRYDRPFVTVNCAAIPRDLIESELFGYEKGAFTGAVSSRRGKFEEASGGTVFLDEVGEIEPAVQAKLLRALQEREIERLGNNKKIKVNFRLISSTNRDLKKEVAEGRFRKDLFYRINVVQIDVPPLRDRKKDIPLLSAEFANEFCVREKKPLTVSGEITELFMAYSWPGNVRQLRNVIERAVVLAKGRSITRKEIPAEICGRQQVEGSGGTITPLRVTTLQAVRQALIECNGNKSQAARTLGISRKAFYKKLKELEQHGTTLADTAVRE